MNKPMLYPEDAGVMSSRATECEKKPYHTCMLYLVKTANFGHWCGYVKVPQWPPNMSTSYNDNPIGSIDVHGGVTFAVARDDGSIVVGFDCGHTGDDRDPLTWNKDWLWRECQSMADQMMRAKATGEV